MIPIDKKQCQSEKSNGYSFMTLGGVPGMIRCTNKPKYILTENEPDPKDGLIGSMSLCEECLAVFKKQMSKDYATIKEI